MSGAAMEDCDRMMPCKASVLTTIIETGAVTSRSPRGYRDRIRPAGSRRPFVRSIDAS